MRSVNVMISKDKMNKHGLCPVYIRIISKRESAYIPTGIKTEPSKWNNKRQRLKSSFKNSVAANVLLNSYITKVNEIFYELEKSSKFISVKDIKKGRETERFTTSLDN